MTAMRHCVPPSPPVGVDALEKGEANHKKRSFSSITQLQTLAVQHDISLETTPLTPTKSAPVSPVEATPPAETVAGVVTPCRHEKTTMYVPDIPPKFDINCQKDKVLLQLVGLNQQTFAAGVAADQEVLVRKMVQQITDWKGRFVEVTKDNKGTEVWVDMCSREAIEFVRRTFTSHIGADNKASCEKEQSIRLVGQTEKVCSAESLPMAKEQHVAFQCFTPEEQDRYRKLCRLHADQVTEAAALIEIPPWTAYDKSNEIGQVDCSSDFSSAQGQTKHDTAGFMGVEVLDETALPMPFQDYDHEPLQDYDHELFCGAVPLLQLSILEFLASPSLFGNG
jgi:hypothetical protein